MYMLGRNDLIQTYYLLERISVAASLQLRIGKSRNNANDSFGKGFHVLKDHVLNCLMTGRCPSKYCSYGRSSTRFFSKIASILKKSATFKGLKSSPRMYWCKFQP